MFSFHYYFSSVVISLLLKNHGYFAGFSVFCSGYSLRQDKIPADNKNTLNITNESRQPVFRRWQQIHE
ncbi:hypothetical protein C1O70_13940 [Morganella morganii]|nr:hypothetical protein C1O70_13940 [Morganella morganii]